jgi:hypothetical protein
LYRVGNLVFFFRVLIHQQIMYIRSGPNKSLNLNIENDGGKTETVISKVLEVSKGCRGRRKVEPS